MVGSPPPLAPGPVLLPGLVYGTADHVLAFWLYAYGRGDFHAPDDRLGRPTAAAGSESGAVSPNRGGERATAAGA